MGSLYFAYGSNMNFDQMNIRCTGSEFVSSAYVNGWKYYINGDGYAGMEKFEGAVTYGCIWRLSLDHWRSLDQYEAVDYGYYSRAEVDAWSLQAQAELSVIAYLSSNQDYGIPSLSYHNSVIEGALQVGLPRNYIDTLEQWRAGPPSD
jgi:gamma-glutamylcyclotransferase